MSQYCAGIVSTPQATWLVGQVEESLADVVQENRSVSQVANLAKLVPLEENSYQSSRPMVSFISKLNPQGEFQLIAVVPEAACLHTNLTGDKVYLLTGLDVKNPDRTLGPKQTAVLRSEDQGKTWQWMKNGFLPKADWQAWSMNPVFTGKNEVWAAGLDDFGFGLMGEDTSRFSLHYSADGGLHSAQVPLPENMWLTPADMKKDLPAGHAWAEEHYSDLMLQVTPVTANQAVLWLSQRFIAYKGRQYVKTVQVTSSVVLDRQRQQWKAQPLRRQTGLFIEAIRNAPEKTVALLRPAGADAPQVATLNRSTLSWEVQGEVPGPFTPARGWTHIREFHVSQKALVVNVGGEVAIMGKTLDDDAVFYSLNWGKTWNRLKMPGYLGLMGLDYVKNRVFWSPGEWYESLDPQIYTYDLK